MKRVVKLINKMEGLRYSKIHAFKIAISAAIVYLLLQIILFTYKVIKSYSTLNVTVWEIVKGSYLSFLMVFIVVFLIAYLTAKMYNKLIR